MFLHKGGEKKNKEMWSRNGDSICTKDDVQNILFKAGKLWEYS